MRKAALLIAALAGLPAAAHAADCGPLKMVDSIQMTRLGAADVEIVPVQLNGVPKKFLLDTGGFFSQVGRAAAQELKLPVRQGDLVLYDASGNISRDQTKLDTFQFGRQRGSGAPLAISPLIDASTPFDGLLAPDYLRNFDLDLDFTTDKMNFFMQDHCPGQVVYWTSPTNAGVVPVFYRSGHIVAQVKLDGHDVDAVIDTGASRSHLLIDDAHVWFGIDPGSPDTPEKGTVNGDATLKTYAHQFKNLSFGDVIVNNPEILLNPKAAGRKEDHAQLTGNRAKTTQDLITQDDMVIGMDVLRKLHIFIAFKEDKMYVSSATAAPAATPAATPQPATPAN